MKAQTSRRNRPKQHKNSRRTIQNSLQNSYRTDAQTAEIAKLAENTFRDINIAFANQLALICEQHGVDVTEVIKLANTHPRVNIHMPGPGVGGPCLPKDPYLLISKSKPTDHDIVKTARKINDYMPKHIVNLIAKALKNAGKTVKNSKIAILGTAYKANVDDPRLSPTEPIIRKLISLNATVSVYDPRCSQSFGAKKANSLHEAVKGADCLTIITDHTEFKNLNLQEIKALMADKPAIIDGRRIINPKEAERLGFLYYGIGLGK
ncbi:MAG: nucleotide sugar dehydrogenase [Candidatus Bathyarchaeia archaeon]